MMTAQTQLLTSRWFEIPERALQHPVQRKLIEDLRNKKYYHITIVAGRRSFKTERFGKRYLIQQAMENSNKRYYAGAPVRKQAQEIFWKDLKELTPKFYVDKISESHLKITLTNKTEINVVGLLEFATVEGGFANGFLISEWQKCAPEVFSQSIEPMINDVGGWVIKEGRPLGKNHLYDDYLKGLSFENGHASYFWTSEDILNEYQISRAKQSLGKIDYEREYLASFETAGNLPYYAYSYLNESNYNINPNIPVIVTCDFNATEKPMSWNVGQRIVEGTQDITHITKTLSFQYTNTSTMCGILDDHFKTFTSYPVHVIFYGDYAGRAIKSNSSYSDWQIIDDYFTNKTKYEKRIKQCRSIRDSIAATNAQLCNSVNERKLFVNKENCKQLIRDFEYCQWKENSKELSDKDDLLGHCSRALDYYNDYEHPIKGKAKATWN